METVRSAQRGVLPDVLPASQYLQDRLQERRARNVRPKRARQSDFGPRRGRDDDIFLDEAEDTHDGRTFDSSPLGAGLQMGTEAGRRRTMGTKDVDEHLDRLTKQNFALKLELEHRREHTSKLQEQLAGMRQQVERAEVLKEEHSELLRINSQLVEELEKRDKAVEEAMDIICGLEDRVADLEERGGPTRPSTANADSGYAGTETHEQPIRSSPPQRPLTPRTPRISPSKPEPPTAAATRTLLNAVDGQTPARHRREPSVLSQKKPSTLALRTVYLETTQSLHPVKSFHSLLSRRESAIDDEEAALDSPRLSVLSESSFPSIYSPKKHLSPDRYAWEGDDAKESPLAQSSTPAHMRQDSIKRVSQWMAEGDLPQQTSSRPSITLPTIAKLTDNGRPSKPQVLAGGGVQYQSLGDALSAASKTLPQISEQLLEPASYQQSLRPRAEELTKYPRPTSFAGPIFGEPLLPPTPDSVSTRMLRASRSSIADEKPLLDSTAAAIKGFDAVEPGLRMAPKLMRSSVELSSAYQNYLQHRDGEPVTEEDLSPEAFQALKLEHEDFPDGNSILHGTPSRFLKHSKPPAANMLFDGNDASSPQSSSAALGRRQSSSELTVSPRKPSLIRSETDSTSLKTAHRVVFGHASHDSVPSPRSYHSGSSNHTILQRDDATQNASLDQSRIESRLTRNEFVPQARPRTSHSPSRTLSKKTQKLFRRLSSTGRDGRTDYEPSPLPTLTSTPSSAYINTTPKQARRPSRPGSEQSGDTSRPLLQRPPSSSEGRRPSLQAQMRTLTDPNTAPRPSSAARVESAVGEKEPRMNPFKRRNSSNKTGDTLEPIMSYETVVEGGARGGLTRSKRGSLRAAVGAARRPWR